MESLTSQSFRQMMRYGANALIINEQELNRINVFPVADGDTGSNMAHLMRTIVGAINSAQEQRVLEQIKQACLIGSRGNSGMILSQFIMSMCDYFLKTEKVSLQQFVEMCEQSVNQAYRVVRKPIEGTILSVMKDWQHGIKEMVSKQLQSYNIVSLLEASIAAARHSLEKTKQQMPLLQKHNVVDAGARGFYYLLQGFVEGLNKSNSSVADSILHAERMSAATLEQSQNLYSDELKEHDHDTELNYRYCTEFLVEHDGVPSELRERLDSFGDSVVLVGNERISKLHIHTNEPDQVAELLNVIGNITYHKVDDMKRQQEMQSPTKSPIALVVDSACDLPQELMDQFQIHSLPLTVMVNQSSYLDKLTLSPQSLYSYVQDGEFALSTSMPNIALIENMYRRLLEHYEEVVVLHVSAQLSGTYNASMQIAKRIDPERIHVFESKTLSGAYGLLVYNLASFITNELPTLKGDRLQLIKEKLDQLISRGEILVAVPSLKSMVRSGRVSETKGLIASLLKIKPLVSVDEHGSSKLLKPSFLSNSNIPKLLKQIKAIHLRNPIEEYVLLYTDDQSELAYLEKQMVQITGIKPSYITTVSTVIGIHAGSGAYSIAMILREENERSYIS